MPTVLRERGYRFSFYSYDLGEPIHVHVTKERCEVSYGFGRRGLLGTGDFVNTTTDNQQLTTDMYRLGGLTEFRNREQMETVVKPLDRTNSSGSLEFERSDKPASIQEKPIKEYENPQPYCLGGGIDYD